MSYQILAIIFHKNARQRHARTRGFHVDKSKRINGAGKTKGK